MYYEKTDLIFFNTGSKVHVDVLRAVPKRDKRSLFVTRAHVSFFTESTQRGKKRVNARFTHGEKEYCILVIDYSYEKQFPAYSTVDAECLLTISLGGSLFMKIIVATSLSLALLN